MFNINLEIGFPANEPFPIGVNREAVNGAMHLIALYTRDVWKSVVSGNMVPGMTEPVNDNKYAASIYVRQSSGVSWEVGTNYADAAKIENGYPAYDMKPGLLASPKARVTNDGQGIYITVPFRHFTGPSRAAHPSGNRNIAPPDIISFLRKNGGSYQGDGGKRSKIPLLKYEGQAVGGVDLQAIVRNEPPPMVQPYTWMSGPQQGMTRIPIGNGERGKYMTFRRVSLKHQDRLPDGRMVWRGSDPNSWIHPGKQANPVRQSVEEYVAPQIQAAYESFMNLRANALR